MGNKNNQKYFSEEEQKAAQRLRNKKYRESEKGKQTLARRKAANAKPKKKRVAHNKKYFTKEERKAAKSQGDKKYRESEKGKKTISSWFKSEIGKSSRKKYNSSKGKEYYIKNKNEIIKKNIAYKNHRRKNDLKTKLVYKLSKALRNTLKIKGRKKNIPTIKLIGCSRTKLLKWIENQFYNHPQTNKEMNWSNWGTQKIGGEKKWHIDHIIPISRIEIDKPETIVFTCHFTNLRPLWADENLKKYNKFMDKEKKKILWRVSNVLGEKGYGNFTSDEILKSIKY